MKRTRNRPPRTVLDRLLTSESIRRTSFDGMDWYSAADVLASLDARAPEHRVREWNQLKLREPGVARLAKTLRFDGEPHDALDLSGVLRLIQSISSPRAERLKRWLADAGRRRLAEANDPELAFLRAQKLYRRRGYAKRWVDKRLRSLSLRQELASEWHHRGASESEHFRALTNELFRAAFGMDVEGYRRYKGLSRTRQTLRDHMSDLELALVALAETTALVLSRDRKSSTCGQLLVDVRDAGAIAARTRQAIEQAGGHRVMVATRQAAKAA